eukprot:1815817-Amphidinium_carterae.2
MSTEHQVVFGPLNAESIHLKNGASKLLVEVDSSCSHGWRFPHIASRDLYFMAGPFGPWGLSGSGLIM